MNIALDERRTQPVPPPPPTPTPPGGSYTVKPGDTLEAIADQHRTTLQAILDINPQVRDPDQINEGEQLNMPLAQVDAPVAKAVDALLGKQATPAQREQAYLQAQQHVDRAGGIGGAGIDAEALPAQLAQVLADAGLPSAIDARVIASVDTVIGASASFEQRLSGYQSLQRYVDQVGGISDQGIVAQALPAKAAELLKDSQTPVGLQAEVIAAVDPLLKPDATPEQKLAAYRTVQGYVDQVGGISDQGIVADALPGKAMQLLVAGQQQTRFAPEVVSSVDQVLAGSATDTQKLDAYQTVQRYVDQVGGVSDQGITAEALPGRAAELLKGGDLPLDTTVVAGDSARDIVVAAQAGVDPQQSLQILGEGYAKADAATRQQLLADPVVQRLISDAASWATEPLGKPPEGSQGDAVPALTTAGRLDELTRTLDQDLAGALLKRTVPAFEAYAMNDLGGPIGIDGMSKLLTVMDRARGSAEGDAAITQLAEKAGLYNINAVSNHIAQGGSPDYAIALGARNDVLAGVQMFADGTVDGKVTAYIEETEELNWLVANHGGSMTPDQLQQAVKDYVASRGPGWEQKLEAMQEDIAQQGIRLQQQIDSLQQAGGYDDTIKGLLADPQNQLALSTALGRHPELATDNRLRDYALYAKVSEGGRKLLGEMGNAYVKANVLPGLQGANPADPAAMQRAEAALARLDNAHLAAAYGVDKGKLWDAVDELKRALPTSGADTEAAATARLQKFNDTLEGIKGFEKGTGLGQLFRGLGVATTSFSFLNSTNRAFAEPGHFANWLKAGADTFGLTQKTADFLVARGADGAVTKAVGGALAGKIATGITGIADAALAFKAASEGDYATAALWGVSAAGGGLTLAASTGLIGSWGGPVGIALVALAAVGIGLVAKTNESNKHMNQTSADFLQHAGFSPQASSLLVDQSGDGHSPVPLLERYAELKGYDLQNPQQRQQFIDWVNNLPREQLESVRDWLHHTLDDWGGDAGKLGTDTTVTIPTTTITAGGYPATVWAHGPYTVGEVDAFVREYGGTPLPRA
jgi:hypothetical protein